MNFITRLLLGRYGQLLQFIHPLRFIFDVLGQNMINVQKRSSPMN